MMTPSTKALLLGLAVAMTPALRGEESSAPANVAAKATKTTKLLNSSFESLAKVLEESSDKLAESEAQRKLAIDELDARRKAQAETQREFAELKKQLAATQKSEASWKGQSEKLAKKLAAGEEAHANLAKFRDQMASTLKEFSSLQGDIASVRTELEAPAERVALRKQNEGLKVTKSKLQKELQETQRQLASERSSHDKTRDQLSATQRQGDILKNALAEATKSNEALTAQLQESAGTITTLKSRTYEAVQDSAVLEKLASRLQFEHSNMSKSLAVAELNSKQIQDKLVGVEAARKAAVGKVNELGAKLQTANTDINKLQRAKVELRQAIEKGSTDLKAARNQFEEAKQQAAKQKKSSEQEIAALNQKQQQTAKAVAALRTEAAKAKQALQVTQQQNEKAVAALRSEANQAKQALGEKLQASQKELTNLRGELQKSKDALTALTNDTNELRKISGLTTERLKRTKQQIQAVEEEKQVLREALKKREAQIANLQANLDKVQSKETAKNGESEE